MTDRPRRGRDKDASTRFMRVDQLFGGKTVEVPAATMLARAAASEARRPEAARREEPPTVAIQIGTAKTLPATTVLRSRGAPSPPLAAHQSQQTSTAASRSGRTARQLALVTALVATGAVIYGSARRSAPKEAATAPVVAAPTLTSTTEPLRTAVARDAHAAQATPAAIASDSRARASLPSIAADQLAAGDHAAALGSYRELARLWPEERVYSLLAEVLEHRLRASCARGSSPGAATCER
jgi:hypothetical protein